MDDNPINGRFQRKLDTDIEEPSTQVPEIVADIEGKDITEITTVWGCTDHVIDHLFSDPPSPEAEMSLEFSYEGYRVTVDQDGTAEFVRLE